MKEMVDAVFRFIGVVTAVVGVGATIYYGQKALSPPGVVVTGVDDLVGSTEKQNETSLGILKAVTPADPIAALAKRSYSIDRIGFSRAFRAGDVSSIALYCEADISPLVGSFYALQGARVSERMADLVKDCSAVDLDRVCDLESPYINSVRKSFGYDKDAVEKICGRAVYRDALARFEAEKAQWVSNMKERCRRKLAEWAGRDSSLEQFLASGSLLESQCASVGVPL